MVAETSYHGKGGDAHDQQALDYALYHLRIIRLPTMSAAALRRKV